MLAYFADKDVISPKVRSNAPPVRLMLMMQLKEDVAAGLESLCKR
jgi:hypothetical protein